MNLLELSQNIRKIRIEQNMTVEQLAKNSGFSKGFISQVENFRITPSLKALTRIADALGVSMSMLFAEDGDTAASAPLFPPFPSGKSTGTAGYP